MNKTVVIAGALLLVSLAGCATPTEHRDEHGALWSCQATPGDCTLLKPPPVKIDLSGLGGMPT